jgi:GntR family transcriptional regulator/MocR family aminotransferase
MTEDELIFHALKKGVRVYGISKYFIHKSNFISTPAVLIGYAAMKEEEIEKAVKLLFDAWF